MRILTLALLLSGWVLVSTQMTLDDSSRLWIDGTSSLHDWTCEVDNLDGQMAATDTDGLTLDYLTLTVPVEAIACKNGTMNRKTRKALKADQYETIVYTLETLETMGTTDDGSAQFSATGTLMVAGNSQEVTFDVTAQEEKDGLRFTGAVPMTMTAFGIDPPTAMLGALKTGDEITIRFDVLAMPDADTL